MGRKAIVFIMLIAWITGGCAANTAKNSTAATPLPVIVDAPTNEGPADSQDDDPAPAVEEERDNPRKVQRFRNVNPGLTIYFKANSNELDPGEITKLDKVAEALQRNLDTGVTLSGYTDSAGSKEYNLMVAEGRASSVKFYLVAKGIDPARMVIVAVGAGKFAADNDTNEGRSLNRRVEIKIDGLVKND